MVPRRTVLIVEDDDALRRMYRIALVLAGYDVQEASDGWSALSQLDQNPPDLVVLDLGLPNISGHVVRQEIAAGSSTRHIPIVIVTAAREDLDHLDVPCVLRKPVSRNDLVESVRHCLAS
jgi:DNA-binding response OmpR family regulator